MTPDPFVEAHKEEIEREAFRIYRQRQSYLQDDIPLENFLAAISIVRNRYRRPEAGKEGRNEPEE